MNYEFGFIGCGNMGGALARAARKTVPGEQILLANLHPEKAQILANELGASVGTNGDVAASCRYIFLGVKPQKMEEALSSVREVLSAREDRFLLVTMAAGLTIERIRTLSGGAYPVIRIMPNTPASVGAGMIQYSASENVSEQEVEHFLYAMSAAGLWCRT